MLSALISVIENEKKFNIGRNALQGLHDFKSLGDRSAHDRRFNAEKQILIK